MLSAPIAESPPASLLARSSRPRPRALPIYQCGDRCDNRIDAAINGGQWHRRVDHRPIEDRPRDAHVRKEAADRVDQVFRAVGRQIAIRLVAGQLGDDPHQHLVRRARHRFGTVYNENIGRAGVRGGAWRYRDLAAIEERVIEHVLRSAHATFHEHLPALVGEQQSGEPARERRTPLDDPHAAQRRRSGTHIAMPLGHLRGSP